MKKSTFGIVIEQLISESKYKYKSELAKATGIPKSTFSNWIHGRHRPEKYGDILGLASHLNNGKPERYRYIVFLLVDALAVDEHKKDTVGKK